MRLIVDIGNSFAKLGVFDGAELIQVERFKHSQLAEIDAFVARQTFESGIIASVIEGQEIENLVKARMPILMMSNQLNFPINICYKTPETLGQDRIAVSVAAHIQMPDRRKLVIDAGSCVTYDYIDEKGNYFGGAISPGLAMRFKALNNFTGKLPLIEKPEAENIPLVGLDTKSCIESGVVQGLIAEVDGVISAYRDQFGDISVFLTGGDGYYFDKTIKSAKFADENMVLKGLKIILEKNAEKII